MSPTLGKFQCPVTGNFPKVVHPIHLRWTRVS